MKNRLIFLSRIIRYGFRALFPLAAIAAICIWGIKALWVILALMLVRTILRILWKLAKLLLCAALLTAMLFLIIL